MTYLSVAQSLTPKEIASVLEERDRLKNELAWYKRQIYGRKSEKRIETDPSTMGDLFAQLDLPLPKDSEQAQETEATDVQAHKRKKRKLANSPDDSGLQFSEDVPVKTITLHNEEYKRNPDDFEIIGEKVTYRLAQQRYTYGILKYVRSIYKRKTDKRIINPPAPENVLDKSIADVSLLAGLLVEKFDYHQPLYRQHRRIEQNGIFLSRTTLTNVTSRAIGLLTPIALAVKKSILLSKTLAMDETPIKFSRKKKGVMKKGYFWPIYGEQGEIYFHFDPSRATSVVHSLLGEFHGHLVTDGYAAYEKYANAIKTCTRSQCWSHGRRGFEKAGTMEKEQSNEALLMFAALYEIEDIIVSKKLAGKDKKDFRQKYSKPLVDKFFNWCRVQSQRTDMVKSNPLAKALLYVNDREEAMRVFLDNPDVPLDTNHLERQIRYIAMGKRSWLFCWTEMGAHQVGVIQSLISSCKIQGVDPYTYLVDVLQRVATHPASQVHELTPRLWKNLFSENPLKSDFHS